jgi:phosphatidylglycerol:prolipoprotein diacylglycerol transferase
MRPVLFHLGALPVSSFWTMAFAGFFAAFLAVRSDVLRRGFDADLAYDMTLYVYVGGWVGARLFLIPSAWDLFSGDPIGFLLTSSGWVWYGGLMGGIVALWILTRRRGLPFLLLADIIAPALALGQGIGRIGCQLSGDGDYGTPTTLPWGMSYPHGVVPTTDYVHPTPIYEMLACFAIFAYLWRRRHRHPPIGDSAARYFILAAVLRFLVEFVRRNPAWLAGLTTAQWFSVAMAIGGALLMRYTAAGGTLETVAQRRAEGG